MNDDLLPLEVPIQEDSIIKVMGVGGGGCNAVNHMYQQGIKGVSFLVCNTDRQALSGGSVPAKLQLGPGLGAGGDPNKARKYAEENRDRIHEALDDGTQMLFLAAGMGGGTGTGASSIVAEVAQEMNILTVGIVTIPFAFEGKPKIRKALTGVATLAEHVDAILVINNEKLKQIYPDLNILNAFSKSNDVMGNAAKSIAEIITIPGLINTDFADVYNTLKDGKVAIMNVGQAGGERRVTDAINNALHSPLVNTSDVHGAKRVLLQFYCSTEYALQTQETDQIHEFVQEVGDEVEVQWGVSIDESLEKEVRVTLIATGYEVSDIPSLKDEFGQPTIEDAIKANYDDIAVSNQKKDDEVAQVIDLQIDQPLVEDTPAEDTTPEVPEETPVPVPEQPVQPKDVSADDIIITFDEEQEKDVPAQPVQQQEQPRRGLAGWMRTRR
ncbi:MAG: cell division protein FtsZ [Paludibacteraceae bacterium]|nr:cell division protein FtsZ [Paludibacteraceae bacterium]